MFKKFRIFYAFIVTLNLAIKFNEGADLNRSNKFLNKSSFAVIEAKDLWQPIVPSRYWLPTPTTFIPARAGSTGSLRRPHNHPQQPQENHNFTVNTTGSHGKHFATSLKPTAKLTTLPLLPTPEENYSQLESHLYPLNEQNSDNTKASEQLSAYQQQLLSSYNTRETQYHQLEISKNSKLLPTPHQVANENSAILPRFSSFHNLWDIPKDKNLPKPSSSSLSVWHSTAPAKHIATPQTDTENTANAMKLPVTTSVENEKNIGNLLPTNSNFPLANEDSIGDIKKRPHQNHLNNPKTGKDIKSLKIANKEAVKTIKIATADQSYDSQEKFWDKLLSNSEGFNNRIKHDIKSEQYELSDNNGEDKKNRSDVLLKGAAATYDDIGLEMFTATAQQLAKATSKTLSAVIAASLRKLEELFEVKSIFSATSNAAALLSSVVQTVNETEITPEIRNFSTQYQTASSVATLTATPKYHLPFATTSKSPTAVSSGRKLKKVKKKFQQILLPLLLAYKLKFVALIPLLAGGLILLVGSTGLAGFFFALFTAVMSLHSGHRNPIVVKKY